MTKIARRHPDGTIYRLGRREPGAWRFPDWLHADAASGTFGSRYDDPDSEYRVLYASSNRACAFIEVLWYHSADAQLAIDIADIVENDDSDTDHATVAPGHLDIEAWCAVRAIGSATVELGRAFASTTDPLTVDTIDRERVLAVFAEDAGLPTPLTTEAVRLTQARAFTQRVSRFVWELSTDDGSAEFAGIHYLSRHDEAADNWALFELEPADPPASWLVVEDEVETPLATNDADLLAAIDRHHITVI